MEWSGVEWSGVGGGGGSAVVHIERPGKLTNNSSSFDKSEKLLLTNDE